MPEHVLGGVGFLVGVGVGVGVVGEGVGVLVGVGVGIVGEGVGVLVGVGVGVVGVGVGVLVGVGVGVGDGELQNGTVIVFVSVVILAMKDNALPVHVIPGPTVIPSLSIIFPAKVVLGSNVVAAPGVHQKSHAVAPFINETVEPATVVRAPDILKTYVPLPLRLMPAVPIEAAPVIQYTFGVYSPMGSRLVSVAKSMAPTSNVYVHGNAFKLFNLAL